MRASLAPLSAGVYRTAAESVLLPTDHRYPPVQLVYRPSPATRRPTQKDVRGLRLTPPEPPFRPLRWGPTTALAPVGRSRTDAWLRQRARPPARSPPSAWPAAAGKRRDIGALFNGCSDW